MTGIERGDETFSIEGGGGAFGGGKPKRSEQQAVIVKEEEAFRLLARDRNNRLRCEERRKLSEWWPKRLKQQASVLCERDEDFGGE
ncbi:hypothetical protein AVEN_181242-1 [Araneus ventricosus]|uniref:Uncharacterized protein n=1 Tax=Araneus ventricosus TaxID=182803 RepID=A0A4Y2K6F8_ARAVE|nr:hypothetical protein AVEN_181242-1 [Araneus ventricosus]